MKIKLRTIKIFGELKPIGKHIVYGGVDAMFFPPVSSVDLYEKGTIREVKTLNIPSFKITTEKQLADIDVCSGMEGSISYNIWSFI